MPVDQASTTPPRIAHSSCVVGLKKLPLRYRVSAAA
jgi:hypothetical protein